MVEPVKITDQALTEILKIFKTKGIPQDYGLRLGVKGGHGCASVNFILGFDTQKETDLTWLVSDFKLLIQKSELIFLIGKKIDFHEGVDARGFIFKDQEEIATTAR